MHGLIAILRGVQPEEVTDIGAVLVEAGITCIEVPFNSPRPLESIEQLTHSCGYKARVGAGTILTPMDVDRAADAGAELILSPNLSSHVVRRAKSRRLISMPGVATPSEGFNALAAGADALKLFPAGSLGSDAIAAWRAIFPVSTKMFCVGGVDLENIGAFAAAGADGVGLGSSLYTPGISLEELSTRAKKFVAVWRLESERNDALRTVAPQHAVERRAK